jgi:hypothetical protein
MKRLLLLLFLPLAVFAQKSNTGSFISGSFANRPVCSRNLSNSNAHNGDVYSDTDDENVYKCAGGTWWTVGGRTTGQAMSSNPAVFDPGTIHAGSDIHVDIRAYGAYATFSSTTCNTTKGSPQVRLTAASNFKSGEYATCYNAGGATTTSTPSAPTVTPSAHAGGMAAVADNVGSTGYAYKIVAEDKNNGRSAASAAGATATGNTSLGQTTIYDFSGCTRSNQTVTCTTTAPHSFVVGQQIWTQNMTDHTFNGNWVTATGTSGNKVTWKSGWDTRMGASTSTTRGSAKNVWGWKMNRLTWTEVSNAFRYHIYGSNCPTTCNWMGQTVLTQWDDYGSTMTSGQTQPSYIPTAAPSSPANEHFTFKITAGGGTSTLTANSNAGVTGSSTIVSDAGPAILAAAVQARSVAGIGNTSVVIPVVYTFGSGYFWQVNSYTDFYGQNADIVLNGGGLIANQPLANAYKIEGIGGGTGLGNFGWDNYPSIAGTAYPMIYSGTRLRHISIAPSNGNGGLAIYALTPILMNYDDFYLQDGGGSSDCIGQAALYNSTSTAFDWNWNRFTITGGLCGSSYTGSSPVPTVVSVATGSGQVGNSPSLAQGWMLNRASVDVDTSNGACEEIGLSATGVWTQNANEVPLQASGICNGGVFVSLIGDIVADYATPLFVNYAQTNQGSISMQGLAGLNGTATGFLSGNPINSIVAFGVSSRQVGANIFMQNQLPQNFLADGTYGGAQPELQMNEQQAMGPGFGVFTTTPSNTAPTCATITAGPPYVPAGTYTFHYAPAYPNGGNGAISPTSTSCSANGTSQQIDITIPSVAPGATGYNVWSGNNILTMNVACGSAMPTAGPTAWTGSTCGGVSPPAYAGSGPAGMANGNLWALDHILEATAAPAGSKNTTQLYMDSSTFWPSFKPNGNRAYVVPGISGPIINGHNLCADGSSGAYVDCLTTQTIARGTATLGTSAIAAKTCATVVTTAATGVVTTDAISDSFNAAPSGAYTTGLFVQSYVTPGNVNFLVCNPTTESLTPPGASLNWRVTR